MNALTINVDGAARGNPGPAAYAYVISRNGEPPIEVAECIGATTNNIAEYTALVRALERAQELGADRLVIHSDSELVVKQMNGIYQVKNEKLLSLYSKARHLCDAFKTVSIRHVRREQNSEADRLCNEALDGRRPPDATPRVPQVPPESPPQRQGKEAVHKQAVTCLQTAALGWARDVTTAPTPDEVWQQLWSILEKSDVLR